MIKHLFKIIWTERRINAWILAELILVFCILWFCADYLYFVGKRYVEPKGFDIEHTYKIDLGVKDEWKAAFKGEEKKQELHDDFWTVMERIEKYGEVDAISLSLDCFPYTGSFSGSSSFVDSIQGFTQYKSVSPEFLHVFKFNIEQGQLFGWKNVTGKNEVMISGDRENVFLKHAVNRVDTVRSGSSVEDIYAVTGVVNKAKRSEYEDYTSVVYFPLNKNKLDIQYLDICIRVKPTADKNFAARFIENMESQLEVGPYFLAGVTPIEDIRKEYMGWTGYSNNFKSIYSVSAFLIINIFLGVIGTFWFCIQSRRSEIGLRVALGASKSRVRGLFVGEAMLLLLIASAVAAVICVNVTIADVLKEIGIPTPDGGGEAGVSRYFINYGITFIFLALIAFLAVWYPAKKASDMSPTEALRDEG